MNIADVKTDIKNKAIKSYYIFTGEEIEIQRLYINKIAEVLGYPIVRAESIESVWPSIISPTLFDTPSVYVVRDDKHFAQDEVLQNSLAQNKLNGNVIINLVSTFDKRSRWYKSNKDKIIVFERLSAELLSKYIQREMTLNKRNTSRLIAICESDYSRILLEIDKIKRFSTDNYDVSFEHLVSEGVIAIPPQDAIFNLVDAILNRQVSKVYDLYEQCKAVGEANMVILSVLFTNTKQTLQVQSCESTDIASSTGLNGWQIKCAKEHIGKYSNSELISIMRLIQEIKKSILIGQIEDDMSVEYLLVNIL